MALAFSLLFVFLIGASVGSFLNVAIARLPLEKSLIWPSSRCDACLQPIRWYDNVPLVSYLWLRGRCRSCGQSYSIVYLLVEFTTALGFVGLFWIEVKENIHGWPGYVPYMVAQGFFPWTSWLGFAWHALLFALLMAVSVCDMKTREIPLDLTFTGTLIGLIGSTLMPWPFPQPLAAAVPPPVMNMGDLGWQTPDNGLMHGIYPWPFWGPIPAWAAPGDNWQTGLATGVVGALVGTFLLRFIGFLWQKGDRREGLGLGDADLMMMVGAFLGWQIVVAAFFLSPIFGLLYGVPQLIIKRDNAFAFGPFLSVSVMVTCLAWRPISDSFRPFFFWGAMVFWCVIIGGVLMFLLSFVMRRVRELIFPSQDTNS